LVGELPAGVALIADQGHAAIAAAALKELQRDLALALLGGRQGERSWCPVGREDRVQPEAPEQAGMARAIPVVSGVSELGALDGLAASGTLHRGAVDEQQIVVEAGALAGEDLDQPLQRLGELAAALEIPGLPRQPREQVPRRLEATAKNRRSDGIPMIACATQSVTTSASVTLLLAFFGFEGRRSSAVT
jgi:hypothetical protein